MTFRRVRAEVGNVRRLRIVLAKLRGESWEELLILFPIFFLNASSSRCGLKRQPPKTETGA